VNKEVEMRNTRKLRQGDIVEFEEKKFEVKSDVLRQPGKPIQ
jgi:ribosome-associated protein YbcJ (S4-like RNA binding protein)